MDASRETQSNARIEVASTLLALSRTRDQADLGETLAAPPSERGASEGPLELSVATSRYQHLRKLGAGGMGEVDQVWDRDLMRRLALKRLLPFRANDDDALRQFLWEARVTAYLDHPHIVPVHDLGLDSRGEPYFTMKFVAGSSLEQLIAALARIDAAERAKLEPDPDDVAAAAEHRSHARRLRLFLDLGQAIAYAHEHGVLHRDLKPANIMLGEFGEVLIMDWGLALPLPGEAGERLRELLPEALRERDPNRSSGTPLYMAPEQALGLELDERSDVYSLGVVLYELLTLRSPYAAKDLTRLLLQISEGEVIPAREFAPELSSSIVAILECAMAREPEHRYTSVRALVDDIEAVLEGLTPRAEQASAHVRMHRYVFAENNPQASMRLIDLDFSIGTGVAFGLLLATFFGGWLEGLGGWASLGLAVVMLVLGFRPIRVIVRASLAGKRSAWGRR